MPNLVHSLLPARMKRFLSRWRPGNGAERDSWEEPVTPPSVMSPAELAEYEDKKLKMKKAMGENLGDAVEGETV